MLHAGTSYKLVSDTLSHVLFTTYLRRRKSYAYQVKRYADEEGIKILNTFRQFGAYDDRSAYGGRCVQLHVCRFNVCHIIALRRQAIR